MVNTREKKSNKCQKTNTNKDQQIYFQSEYTLKNKQYSFFTFCIGIIHCINNQIYTAEVIH